MVYAKLRNLKLLVLNACRTKNILPKAQWDSLRKLNKLTEERKCVIFWGDEDEKIVILHNEDYKTMMKKPQQFEQADVPVDVFNVYLDTIRNEHNILVIWTEYYGCSKWWTVATHIWHEMERQLHRKVNGGSTKFIRSNTPVYAHPRHTTQTSLLNVYIKYIPVRLVQTDFLNLPELYQSKPLQKRLRRVLSK